MAHACMISEQDVWQWCFESYLRYNIKLKLPFAKDYTKTYQWRFVKAITDKFNDWGFNDDTCRRFIDIAVTHAKELGVLHKGLSILHQHNMMDICYKKLKTENERSDFILDRLVDTKKFLESLKMANYKIHMLRRNHNKALSNFTTLYMSKMLPIEFISLNKCSIDIIACLENIDPEERRLLPTDAALYLCRKKIVDLFPDSEILSETIRWEI